jgi:outer membrane protein assembly factor BamA
MPQDDLDILLGRNPKFASDTPINPVRGGNLMFNPRAELRIPVVGPLETVAFVDVGNLWRDLTYPFEVGRFPMRASVGSGIRVATPVGLTLALDYGINVTRHLAAQEDFGALQFAIGLF